LRLRQAEQGHASGVSEGGMTAESNTPASAGAIWRAMMLSLNIETCEALLRGESVPLERLDLAWLKRLGLVPVA
jgi:hypothetical protein